MLFRIFLLLPTCFRKIFLILDPFTPDFSGTFLPEIFSWDFHKKNFPANAMNARFAIFQKHGIASFATFLLPTPTSCSRP